MDWNQRPLFKNPHNLTGGGSVGMPIPGYQRGAMVMPDYEKLIEDAAAMYAQSDPTSWGYEADLHQTSRDISLSTAQTVGKTKEEVMADLQVAITAQRNSSPNGYMQGGIIDLQEAGMVPELFEGQEIVEIHPELNQRALGGNGGITSSRAAGAELPERNVPDERGIIELALDTEEVEDDNPMLAMAEQEAKGRLDEEFSIVKSTAQAEAATGEEPAFVIKRGMDDLARTAGRIEQDVIERYPEIPLDTNLIDSEDLVPYQEELVAVFQTPEIAEEEFLMAESGGLIPGYQEGTLPTEWAWIDEDIREIEGVSLEQAEELMVKKYGKTIQAMKALVEEQREGVIPRIRERRRLKDLTYGELLEERKREGSPEALIEKQLIEAIQGSEGFGKEGFLTKLGRTGGELSILKDPDTMALIRQYEKSQEPLVEEELTPTPTPTPTPAPTTAGPTTGDQNITEEQINALIEAAISADRKASPTEPSPEVVAAKQAITDLKEGYETEGTEQEKDLDVTALTDLYDTEVEEANTAITTATTAISDAITAQLKHIEEQEDRIPELSRMASRTEPTRGVGRGQQSYIKRMRQKEIQLNMENKISGKKQALSALEADLASLEKQAQEARRNQNVQALMDIKRQQINLIAELRMQTGDKKDAAELALRTAELNHALKLDEIRLEAELGLTGGGSSQGERMLSEIEKLDDLITQTTDPTEKGRLQEKRDNRVNVLQGSFSDENIIKKIMANADDPESGLETALSMYDLPVIVKYIPAYQGTRALTHPTQGTINGTFIELHSSLSRQKNEDTDRFYTTEEIIGIWRQGREV